MFDLITINGMRRQKKDKTCLRGTTPLIVASQCGHEGVVRVLADLDADLNAAQIAKSLAS